MHWNSDSSLKTKAQFCSSLLMAADFWMGGMGVSVCVWGGGV